MRTAKQAGATAAVALAVFAIIVGVWFAYWKIAKAAQTNRYDVNTHSQQYQANLIAEARDLANGYNHSTSADQRTAIADQFCAIVGQIDPAPSDLQRAASKICSPID